MCPSSRSRNCCVQRHHTSSLEIGCSLRQHNISGTATVIAALRHDARALEQAFATTVVVQMLVHGAALYVLPVISSRRTVVLESNNKSIALQVKSKI
jgi:hypothetical protein